MLHSGKTGQHGTKLGWLFLSYAFVLLCLIFICTSCILKKENRGTASIDKQAQKQNGTKIFRSSDCVIICVPGTNLPDIFLWNNLHTGKIDVSKIQF